MLDFFFQKKRKEKRKKKNFQNDKLREFFIFYFWKLTWQSFCHIIATTAVRFLPNFQAANFRELEALQWGYLMYDEMIST